MTTAETTSSAEPAAEPSQVKDVLERAIADPAFGRLLLDDPDAALADYDLSEVQLLLLRSLDEEDQVIGYYTHVIAACSLPEDTVYKMTAAINANKDGMAAVYRDMAKLTPENLEEFFAVDSAVYTPEDAAMVQQGYEIYDEEDLED